jgi:hypothetical protein
MMTIHESVNPRIRHVSHVINLLGQLEPSQIDMFFLSWIRHVSHVINLLGQLEPSHIDMFFFCHESLASNNNTRLFSDELNSHKNGYTSSFATSFVDVGCDMAAILPHQHLATSASCYVSTRPSLTHYLGGPFIFQIFGPRTNSNLNLNSHKFKFKFFVEGLKFEFELTTFKSSQPILIVCTSYWSLQHIQLA